MLINIRKSQSGGGDGAEVIYALRNDDEFSRRLADAFISSGQNFRSYYQRRGTTDPSTDYYYMHRNTPNNETVIVEYGFLDSDDDDVSQIKNDWEKMAEAVVKATVEYAGGVYKPLESVPSDNATHIVKSGDTLYGLAKLYNTTVSELKTLNNLVNDSLYIGQEIILPTSSSESKNSYVVQAGDSLYSIAKKFNTTVDVLKALNNLTSDNLSINQVLIVTDDESETVTPDDPNIYIVKSGDTLYSIAKKYNMSADELMKLNNLSSNLLSVGQILKINNNLDTEEYTVYTVKSGDNLYALAREFDTTVDEIKNVNNLDSDILSIGQILKIPNVSLLEYTVVSGDSLYSIARKYNTTVSELKTLNKLTSDILSIGQVLKLP